MKTVAEMSARKILAESLLRSRMAQGLSQKEVAVEFGCTEQQVCSWETGRTVPRADTWMKLREFYRRRKANPRHGVIGGSAA